MKKTYINPEMETMELKMNCAMLTGSGGVTSGSQLGGDYTSTDVSYSRGLFLDGEF